MNRPRYLRAPSPILHAHLTAPGLLAPLLRPRAHSGVRLDVHLREGNRVHAYHAQARVIDARLEHDQVHIDAHATFRASGGTPTLFTAWRPGDPAFAPALDQYLAAVTSGVEAQPEGHVQAVWSGVLDPWVPIDREAVIGYPDVQAQRAARQSPAVTAARGEVAARVAANTPRPWASLPAYDRCAELDQLAIDPDGRLVLIELKHGPASSDSVYYAPLQLLQYAHEWRRAFAQVRADVEAVRDARVAVGLSPSHTPRLNGELRLALGFGEDVPSPEVVDRLKIVRTIANLHLPDGVGPIEVWAMRSGAPVRQL